MQYSPLNFWQNTPAIDEKLVAIKQAPETATQQQQLVQAVQKGNLKDADFQNEVYPYHALLAYQQQALTLEQAVSILLRWCAFHDYAEAKGQVEYHDLASNSKRSERIFRAFLKVQQIPFTDIDDHLSATTLDRIVDAMRQPHIPASEKQFMTIQIHYSLLAPILARILQLKFHFFMPIRQGSDYLLIIPSFTILQTALSHITTKPIKLIPSIGLDTAHAVAVNHARSEHPFCLSVPGFTNTVADGYEAGCYGVAMHEVYHATNLAYITIDAAIFRLYELGILYCETVPKHREFVRAGIDLLIDSEFRAFMLTSDKYLEAIKDPRLLRLFQSKEFQLWNCINLFFIYALLKDVMTKTEEDAMPTTIKEKSFDQDKIQVLEQLILVWINDILVNASTWMAAGISRSHYASLLDMNGLYQALIEIRNKSTSMVRASFMSGETIEKLDVLMLQLHPKLRLSLTSLGRTDSSHAESKAMTMTGSFFNQYEACKKQIAAMVTQGDVSALKKASVDPILLEIIPYPLEVVDAQDHCLAVLAVMANQLPMLSYLYEMRQFDVNSNFHFRGAKIKLLHLAAKLGHSDIVKWLLEHDANFYQQDEKLMAAVDYSIQLGDTKSLMVFLQYGVPLSQYHLRYLKQQNLIHEDCKEVLADYAQFKSRLQTAFDHYDTQERISQLQTLATQNPRQFSPTTLLDFKNETEEIKTERDSEINSNAYSSTIDRIYDEETMTALKQVGPCKFNFVNDKGENPLFDIFKYSFSDNTSKLLMLVAVGCRVTQMSRDDTCAITNIIMKAPVKAIIQLFETDPTLTVTLKQMGHNLLVDFINRLFHNNGKWSDDLIELFKFLVKQGFNLNQEFPENINRPSFLDFNPTIVMQTPWSKLRNAPIWGGGLFSMSVKQIGCLSLPLELRQFCVEQGANPNQPDFNGQPELFWAIENGLEDYVNLLLQHKADLYVTDKKGNTVLHIAALHGQQKLIKLFLDMEVPIEINDLGQLPHELATDFVCKKLLTLPANLADVSQHLTFSNAASSQNPGTSAEPTVASYKSPELFGSG